MSTKVSSRFFILGLVSYIVGAHIVTLVHASDDSDHTRELRFAPFETPNKCYWLLFASLRAAGHASIYMSN